MILLSVRGGKGCLIRPQVAAAHLIVVSSVGRQTGQENVIKVCRDVSALGKVHLGGIGLGSHPILRAGHGIADALLTFHGGVADPADVLFSGLILGGVEADVIGQGFLGHVIYAHIVLEGQQAGRILSVYRIRAGGLAEGIRGQLTLFIGGAHQRVVRGHVDAHAHSGLALGVHHGQRARAGFADDDGVRGDGVFRAHGQSCLRLMIGGVGPAIGEEAAALHGVAEECTLGQVGRNADTYRGHKAAVVPGHRLGVRLPGHIHGQLLAELAVAIGPLIAVGKDHLIVGEKIAPRQDGGGLGDGSVGGQQLQIHGLTDDGRLLQRLHLHGGSRGSLLHGKGAGLSSLVAEFIAQRDGDGMLTVLQLQVIQIVHGAVRLSGILISVVAHHIDIVDIHADGVLIDAGGILVLHIVEHGSDVQLGVLQHCAVLQLLAVDGDRVHNRCIHIVHIGAVHKLQVIEIDCAGCFATHIRARNIHQTEGHAGLNAVGCCQLCQVSLQVFPAFPGDTGLHAVPFAIGHTCFGLQHKVIGLIAAVSVADVTAQPEPGLGAVALILNAHTLRRIDPHADACRHTGNRHACRCTDTGALGHRTASCVVIIQLQGFGAETDRLIVVNADDLHGLLTAAAIVAVCQNSVLAHIIVLGRGHGTGLRIHMVLKVPHDGGQHAHDDVNGALDRLVPLGGGDKCSVKGFTVGGGEGVAVEGAHFLRRCGIAGSGLYVLDAPQNVPGLDVHVPVLTADHQAEIRFLGKAQADLLIGEVDAVGHSHIDGGAANDLPVQAQLHTQGAALFTDSHQAGLCIHAAQVLAVGGNGIGSASGQIHSHAGGIHALGLELDRAAGGIYLIIGAEHSVVKHAGLHCGGNHQQRGADCTLRAVGGRVAHHQLVRALRSGAISGGAAAVQCDGGHASGVLQHLCHLVIGAATGNRRTQAVCNEGQHCAVRPDTDGRAAVLQRAVGAAFGNDFPIIDQDHIAAHCGLQITQVRSATDHGFAVLGNAEIVAAVCLANDLAIHNQRAHGFAGRHVEEVRIDSGHHRFTGVVLLIGLGLCRGGGKAPRTGIVLAVAGNDLDVFTHGDLGNIVNMLLVASGNVGDDLMAHYAVRNGRHGVLHQNLAVCYAVFDRGRAVLGRMDQFHGNQAHQHQHRQYCRQEPGTDRFLRLVLHPSFISFPFFIFSGCCVLLLSAAIYLNLKIRLLT